ncbi:uncharacterized protein LOC111708996 [Eurytemora carolleeae]|uniref:uncharacterized protein LOC111708996 n=1 Tax=Eurytemora carolleeae TaxID=1294199 RepID=UPI000C782DD5|nr:uncharacterized protein LOC111708996 [Eurytemora carolleeae]|eukprot:XP_023338304.1 uncharacterized protein LOC111708996 [Eurytemora affinis]
MFVHLVIWLSTQLAVAYAPFDPGYPYNWANPFIEPRWEPLPQEAKEAIYSKWELYEPYKLALAEYKDKHERRMLAEAKAWEAGKSLIHAKAKELKSVVLDDELTPSYANPVEGQDHESETVKTESRYKGGSQLPWENFQSAFQHAIYLRLAEKRALYQKTLESARIQTKYGKAAERKIFEIKDSIQNKYLEGLEKFKDDLYHLWLKGEDIKANMKKEMGSEDTPEELPKLPGRQQDLENEYIRPDHEMNFIR